MHQYTAVMVIQLTLQIKIRISRHYANKCGHIIHWLSHIQTTVINIKFIFSKDKQNSIYGIHYFVVLSIHCLI